MACMCLNGGGCCYCDSSLPKAVQVIAVIDLIVSIVIVPYETANFGKLTNLILPYKNCSNCTRLRDYVPEDMLKKVDVETITVMTMIVLVFVGFIIEGNLYSKLKTGKRMQVHLFCKKWFEWRLILLLVTVIMAVAKYFRGFYALPVDAIIDGTTKTYRIITMCFIKCFMNELALVRGTVYVKPAKPRKRGSLSLK